jgi:hypothetical protein
MATSTSTEDIDPLASTQYLGQAPSLFVTADDIEHVKAAARAILPDMAPQHRIEAVARALRFNTFAGLQAAMRKADINNPLLLQMAFGTRSSILEEAFQRHRQKLGLAGDSADIPLSALAYIAVGAAFLNALYAAREGTLKSLGQEAMLRMGLSDHIDGHHRAAALQGLHPDIAAYMREQGAVFTLPTGVEIVPIARILGQLDDEDGTLLINDLEDALDYDLGFVDYNGEGKAFGPIAFHNAVFVSDNVDRIDVLPLGWYCDWPFSTGADTGNWVEQSYEKRLAYLRKQMRMLTKELGVPKREIARVFRMVPELAGEPEARKTPNIAALMQAQAMMLNALR